MGAPVQLSPLLFQNPEKGVESYTLSPQSLRRNCKNPEKGVESPHADRPLPRGVENPEKGVERAAASFSFCFAINWNPEKGVERSIPSPVPLP